MQENVIGPGAVRHEASVATTLDRAVGVLDVQLQDQLRRAEGPDELDVPPAGDVVHAVAQHDSHGVPPRLSCSRHVVGGVEAGLAVVGPAGIENPVAHAPTVQPQLVVPEPADIAVRRRIGLITSNSRRKSGKPGCRRA